MEHPTQKGETNQKFNPKYHRCYVIYQSINQKTLENQPHLRFNAKVASKIFKKIKKA